ncbi:MAG: efflux transporter periplasmic adaptor subunit, partial [Nitrosospira sp.]|nr:efflux transporter periplasmic adaptor subunit [Nitrosospira sp.]
WEGRIIRTEGALDEETGLLHAVAEIRDPYTGKAGKPPLMPGLFVKAEIEGREQSGIYVLPPGAVNAAQEASLIDAEDRLHIRRLDILRREPDRVLVRGGLKTGDRVVVSGIQIPIEGMKVRTETVPPAEGLGSEKAGSEKALSGTSPESQAP